MPNVRMNLIGLSRQYKALNHNLTARVHVGIRVYNLRKLRGDEQGAARILSIMVRDIARTSGRTPKEIALEVLK